LNRKTQKITAVKGNLNIGSIRSLECHEPGYDRPNVFRGGQRGRNTGDRILIAEHASMRTSGMGDEYRDDEGFHVVANVRVPDTAKAAGDASASPARRERKRTLATTMKRCCSCIE